jgi:hypothetical protein
MAEVICTVTGNEVRFTSKTVRGEPDPVRRRYLTETLFFFELFFLVEASSNRRSVSARKALPALET